MKRLTLPVALRVARYLIAQPGFRRLALAATLSLGVLVVGLRQCAKPATESGSVAAAEGERADGTPAFCRKLDPDGVYVFGEVGEKREAVRAIASVDDPTSYCEIPNRKTSLPSLGADRRLLYVEDLGTSGERVVQYDPAGNPSRIETPNCTTRFGWLAHAGKTFFYGCEVRDPYEKTWIPVFYREGGKIIGYGLGVRKVIGQPSGNSALVLADSGPAIVNMETNSITPISDLPPNPRHVRAVSDGFLATTDSPDGKSLLWRIERNGRAKLQGEFAALGAEAIHAAQTLTKNGELYEYVYADREDPSRRLVVRTLKKVRTVYSEADLERRGIPFVRLTGRDSEIFTSR